LSTCAYLDAGEPIVLLGDSGTDKSHLLIGFGIAACEQGRRVRYATAAQLVNELAESADERRLSRIVARYGRLDLALGARQGSLEPVIEMNLRALTEVGLEPARAPKVRQLACA
jgi:IstB-like ATP binding protein